MFGRFTERARQVIIMSYREALDQGHDHIGTEHMFTGLLREGEGIGAVALNSLGVNLEETRSKVLEIVPRSNEQSPKHPPFSPHAKYACELALRETLSQGHNYVGTEHVLLGLVRDSSMYSGKSRREIGTNFRAHIPEGKIFPDDETDVVGETLSSFNVSHDDVRNVTMNLLTGRPKHLH